MRDILCRHFLHPQENVPRPKTDPAPDDDDDDEETGVGESTLLLPARGHREECLRGWTPKIPEMTVIISGHVLKCQDSRHAEQKRGPH